MKVPELLREIDVLLHAATGNEYFPVRVFRCIDDLLNTIEPGAEGADDDPPFRRRNESIDRFRDDAFAGGVSGLRGVRAVCDDREHAALPHARNMREVGGRLVDRREIEFEIPGVDDRAERRVNRDTRGVGDAVRHAEEFDFD
jgi:hypothetical protein